MRLVWGCSCFPHMKFVELIWISYSFSKWRFSCSWNGHIGSPPVMLTMEPGLIIIFWAHNPTSSKYISPFWYLFLESHQITYHSNVGVLIRKVTNKGSFTLLLIFGRMKGDLKLLCYAQADEEGRSNADDFCTATGQQLEEEYTKDGTLDFRGRPARKSRTGSWKTSWFIYCKFFLANWRYGVWYRVNIFVLAGHLIEFIIFIV